MANANAKEWVVSFNGFHEFWLIFEIFFFGNRRSEKPNRYKDIQAASVSLGFPNNFSFELRGGHNLLTKSFLLGQGLIAHPY